MDLLELVKTNKSMILEIAKNYGAQDVRVFGSVARGDFNEKSDIDFLVNFKPGTSLLDWCGLRLDLEDLLGRHVDIASEKTLKPRLKNRIINEAINL